MINIEEVWLIVKMRSQSIMIGCLYRPPPPPLLEDIVCHSLDNHVNSHKLSSNRQWGYKKGHSTDGMLLHLSEKWKKALDNGYKLSGYPLRLSESLQTVNHEIRLQKLKSVRIFGSLFSWLKGYLQNSMQYTKVNGKFQVNKKLEMECHKALFLAQDFIACM